MTRKQWEAREAKRREAREVARQWQMNGWRVEVRMRKGQPMVRAVKRAWPRMVTA